MRSGAEDAAGEDLCGLPNLEGEAVPRVHHAHLLVVAGARPQTRLGVGVRNLSVQVAILHEHGGAQRREAMQRAE